MTTQGQAPGWFAKNWKLLALLGVGGLLSCCCLSFVLLGLAESATSSARVDCGTPGPEGVDCVIKRTGGESGFEACWELAITCANKGVMVGSGCGKVLPGESTSKVNMPVASFSNQEACDAPKSGQVEKLTVEEF